MTNEAYRENVAELYRYFILLGKLKEHILDDVSSLGIDFNGKYKNIMLFAVENLQL